MKLLFKFITISFLSLLIMSCNSDSSKKTTDSDSTVPQEITGDTKVIPDTSHNETGLVIPMNSMMNRMKGVNLTGDFDIDFANLMIEHHQGGVEMSGLELNEGKDETMKAMAQKIMNAQKKEIDELREFVKTYKPSNMVHGEGELKKSLETMESNRKIMSMSGDPDKDFASMMIMHHGDGINMAKMQVQHGMSATLKQMAKKSIDEQTKEIGEFKKWLAGRQ